MIEPDFLGVPHHPLALAQAFKKDYDEASKDDRGELVQRILATTRDYRLIGYRHNAIAEKFHRSKARNRICLGGTRSGKSEALAQEVTWWITGRHPYRLVPDGVNGWYASESFNTIGQSLWPKVESRLKGLFDYEVSWINRGLNQPGLVTVFLPSGKKSKISWKSYEQDRKSFQSAGLDFVAFDEQCPQDVFIEANSRAEAGRPFNLMAAFTPIIAQAWMQEICDNPGPHTEKFEFPLDLNRKSEGGWFDDSEIDAMIAQWPPETRDTRRLGKWGSYVGAVYKTFNRATHVVTEPDERKYLPDGKLRNGQRLVCAIDFGAANPWVCLFAAKIPHMDNEWYVFDEYVWNSNTQGVRLARDHAEAVKKIAARWNGHLHTIYADPEDLSSRNELSAAGLPTLPARKDVQPGIEEMQKSLMVREDTKRPRLHIAARCKNLIREFGVYRYEESTDKRDAKPEPLKKDDHCQDACRYLVYSEYKSAPPTVIITPGMDRKLPSLI